MVPSKIPLLGIAGGIASGKTLIAGQIERLGAALVSADQAAHDILKLTDVKTRARQRWGDAIFASDGEILRPALGKIVFAAPPDGPRERAYLERLTHPHIGELLRKKVEEINRAGTAPAIVLDVPLLYESGWNKFCTQVWFVDVPREMRQARAMARGWTAEEFARREATQESLESKRAQADVVIDNSGSTADSEIQVKHFWKSLVDSLRSG